MLNAATVNRWYSSMVQPATIGRGDSSKMNLAITSRLSFTAGDTTGRMRRFLRPDCQAAYETLSNRGAEFLTPPVNWGYEIRCFFRDPDGHLLEISQVG